MTSGIGGIRRKTRLADAPPTVLGYRPRRSVVATEGNLQRSGEDQPLTRQLGKVGHSVACKEKRVKGESKKSREPPYIGFPLYPLQRRRCDLTGHAVADFTFSEAPCSRYKNSGDFENPKLRRDQAGRSAAGPDIGKVCTPTSRRGLAFEGEDGATRPSVMFLMARTSRLEKVHISPVSVMNTVQYRSLSGP